MNGNYDEVFNAPAIGRLVTEEYALGQFSDNCLSVLPSNVEGFAEKADRAFNQFYKSTKHKDFLNKYDIELFDNKPVTSNHLQFDKAIMEQKSNLVLPLYTPHASTKQYLLVRSEGNYLENELALMLRTAEEATKHSMNEMFGRYALANTTSFCSHLNNAVKKERLKNFYVFRVLKNMFCYGKFYANFSLPSYVLDILDINGFITYKKRNELVRNAESYIKKVKRNDDPEAKAVLGYILKSLDVDSLLYIVSNMPKKQREIFCHIANPIKIAEESKVRLEVRKAETKDKKFKTNGKYRLFLLKDSEQQQVKFKYKESIIIYLIYLIDKLKKDSVDSLNINNYKPQFVKLFDQVYSHETNEAIKRFDDLVNHIKDGKPHQAQIKLCYMDIRQSIGDTCEKMNELSAPFILKDAHDHLSVLKERITIHQDLLNLVS